MTLFARWLMIFTLLGFSQFAAAGKWNDATLEKAKKQAIANINQYITNQSASPLNRQLAANAQNQLNKVMKFSQGSPADFASLTNQYEVINFIVGSLYGEKQIPYLALLLEKSPPRFKNIIAANLYESMLRTNEDSAAYTFSRLDKLILPPNSKLAKKRKDLHRYYGFYLRDIYTHNEQENPEICLNFSLRVRKSPAQQWQSLIHVTPAPKGDWAYKGETLCFNGDWQTRYQVSVDKALQSHNRLALDKGRQETLNSGMRKPTLRFAATGNVLNANEQRHIGIATANIDQVNVSLWHVPVNNLSNEKIKAIIQSPQDISDWRFDKIVHREAEQLYRGTFDVGSYAANETVINNVFFNDLTKGKPLKPGIYLLAATDSNDEYNSTQLAFSLSNAGFSGYLTSEGLWAELRHLNNTQPIAGQQVSLYSRNNTVLGTAMTDDKGVAYFKKPMISGKDGLRPDHIVSNNGSYFAYLAIDEKMVDLSDKGLSGSLDTAPLQSWIWADRGIYRPNDTAHTMWLLKTKTGKPFHDTPIWLTLSRPDGKVFLEKMITADASGAYSFDHYFSHTARQGNWTMDLYLGKPSDNLVSAPLIASYPISVAAITPQQIEVAIAPLKHAPTANNPVNIQVQADWLYGAPAADLVSSITHQVAATTLPLPAWKDWQIGLHDEQPFAEQQLSDSQQTTADGSSQFSFRLNKLPFSTQPLQLAVTADVVEPSGQVVNAKYRQLIQRQTPYVALKSVADKQVSMALLDSNGQLQSGKVTWQLYRVHYDYYWYRQDGQWQYQHNESRQQVKQGNLTISANQPNRLSLPLDDGTWVLSVRGENPQTAASIPLEYGRYARPNVGSAPDSLVIRSDKTRYADGETVKLQLRAPFDGQASVKLANNNRIIDNHLLTFTNGKATLNLTWDKSWNQGLWLLANAWQPKASDNSPQHNRRAMGLHWLGGDLTPYALDIAMDLPEQVLPQTKLTIPVHIPSHQLDSGKPTWVRVAAIDDGLYRLAAASFSSPLTTFFGKKQLDIEFFDVWGQIIQQLKGRQAALRSGAGDDESMILGALKSIPELDLSLVTFWSAPVQFDANGNAAITVDLPRFNGRLRVMAAAWNEQRLGSAEQTVQVKSPLVATLYSPPYLSPNDRSHLRLRLHNTTDKPMTIRAAIQSLDSGKVALSARHSETHTLDSDQVVWVNRDLTVADHAKGRTQFEVNIDGDVSEHIQRFADIRPPAFPQKQQQFVQINAGQTQTFPAANAMQVSGKLAERQLFISTTAPFDVHQIIKQLSVYPYGCSEQLTAKAWNNVLLAQLIPQYQLSEKQWGNDSLRENHIFTAQSRLANQQNRDGGFSLWGHGYSEVWLTAYVSEFLLAAQQQQQLGNPAMLNSALQYLRQAVFSEAGDKAASSYALYVLAKAGLPVQGSTVRFAENLLNDVDNKASLTLDNTSLHSVAALVYQGELALATQLLEQAEQQTTSQSLSQSGYAHYGSTLRNQVQSLTTLYALQTQLRQLGISGKLKAAVNNGINRLWSPLRQSLATQSYYSTQDLHWLSLLATQLPKTDGKATLTLNGKPLTISGHQAFNIHEVGELQLINQDKQTLYATLNDWIIPPTDRRIENGYKLTMRYEDNNGNPVDITRLAANQQVLAVVTITPDKGQNDAADVIFAYPLPAGLTTLPLAQSGDSNADKAWFKQLKPPTFSEHRDDRYLAAFRMEGNQPFTHTFMLRAARKGVWHAPAYSLENMYLPELRAVYPSATVTID